MKIDGSIAMTGMLNFTGTGDAGLQLNNLTDMQKTALSAANGMLVYNTTLSALQFYNGAWLTLGIGNASAWENGAGTPNNANGNNGDYYLNTANGSVYQKSAGAWAVIYAGGAALNGPVTFSSAVNIPFTFGSSPAFWQVNVTRSSSPRVPTVGCGRLHVPAGRGHRLFRQRRQRRAAGRRLRVVVVRAGGRHASPGEAPDRLDGVDRHSFARHTGDRQRHDRANRANPEGAH